MKRSATSPFSRAISRPRARAWSTRRTQPAAPTTSRSPSSSSWAISSLRAQLVAELLDLGRQLRLLLVELLDLVSSHVDRALSVGDVGDERALRVLHQI